MVNEGYWGLQDDMPWTFANIWEVLIMKRMLVHECFAEVFQKMFNGVHSVLGAGPYDFEFINLLLDAVWLVRVHRRKYNSFLK